MRKSWFLAGLILVVALATMLFASLSIGCSYDRETVEKMLAEAKARRLLPDERKSAIYGDLREGDALPHYLDAAKFLAQIASQFAEPIPANARPKMRELVAPVVAAMRRGTHCKTVRAKPHPWSIGDAEFVNVVSVAYKCLIAQGEDLEAVRVWLDAAAFAVVLERRFRYNYQPAEDALANCWSDAELASLSAEARSLMVAGLLWLEEALLEPIDWRQYLVTQGTLTLSPRAFADQGLLDRLSAWRAGFSPQRASIRELSNVVDNLQMLAVRPSGWRDRCEQFAAFRVAVEREGSEYPAPLFDFMDRWRRVLIARLRMLRIAIALHAGQELEPVANPLGDGAIPVLRSKGRYVLRVGGDLAGCERIVDK